MRRAKLAKMIQAGSALLARRRKKKTHSTGKRGSYNRLTREVPRLDAGEGTSNVYPTNSERGAKIPRDGRTSCPRSVFLYEEPCAEEYDAHSSPERKRAREIRDLLERLERIDRWFDEDSDPGFNFAFSNTRPAIDPEPCACDACNPRDNGPAALVEKSHVSPARYRRRVPIKGDYPSPHSATMSPLDMQRQYYRSATLRALQTNPDERLSRTTFTSYTRDPFEYSEDLSPAPKRHTVLRIPQDLDPIPDASKSAEASPPFLCSDEDETRSPFDDAKGHEVPDLQQAILVAQAPDTAQDHPNSLVQVTAQIDMAPPDQAAQLGREGSPAD